MTADTLSLTGKTALVTGSGREGGIGAGIARALAKNGASVAIHHVSNESRESAQKIASELAKDFGVKTAVVQGAVQDQNATTAMVEQTLKGLGTDCLDILSE